jgi:predicted anti-sigma-YlaC factor YlaD
MRCHRAEKLILRSLDHVLTDEQARALSEHLQACSACRTLEKEYQGLRLTLQSPDFPEPKPYFWDRLEPRIREAQRIPLWAVWKQLGLRAIPCALAVIVVVILAANLIFAPQPIELSQSGILLRNQNPFEETPLLAEDEVENPNMVLIFSSVDESGSLRRYYP